MLGPQLLLALVALLFARQARAEQDSGFLILRSKSYNTISQEELFSGHHYSIFDIKKGNSLVDFNIEIRKTNITTLSEAILPVNYDSEQLKIISFFIGKLQKKRVSAILTHDLFEIRNILVGDTQQELLRLDLTSGENDFNKQLSCHDRAQFHCQFTDMEHGMLDNRVFVVIQLKRSLLVRTNPDPKSTELFFLLVHLKSISAQLKINYSTDQIPIDTLLKSSGMRCGQDQMAILDNFDSLNNNSILIARFCPTNPNDQNDHNQLFIEEFVKEDHRLVKKQPKSFASYSNRFHTDSPASKFSLLRVVPSLNYTVIATANHIITIKISDLRIALEKWTPDSPQTLQISIVLSMSLEDIYCNFINIRELCCTSKLRREPTQKVEEVYKLLEFMVLENALIPIVIPLKIESSLKLVYSLNTKNYIVLRFKDSLYFCYRRENVDFYINENETRAVEQADKMKSCSKIEVSEDYDVAYIKKLLYEENYSNPIDGYVAVALVEKKPAKPSKAHAFHVQPMLITGSYFTFTLDMKLNQFVCKRYFRNCAYTNITFVESEAERKYHIKPVYIVDEDFNSVISLQNDTEKVHLKNNGKLSMRISEFFFGDVIRPRVVRHISNESDHCFVGPSSNDEFYATTPKAFRYVLKQNLVDQLGLRHAKVDWAYIKINSDKTINVAVSLSGNLGPKTFQDVFKTAMPIDLDPANKTYTKVVMTTNLRISENRYILPIHAVDKDTVYMMTIDKSGSDSWGLDFATFKGKYYTSTNSKAETISISENEELLRVRTALNRDKDLIALISNMAIYIRRVDISSDNHFPSLMTIPFTDFLKSGSDANITVLEVFDLLTVKNIMLIDLRVSISKPGIESWKEKRIYIYNLDLERIFFYSYGYIQINSSLSTTDYSLYYSKEVDKAILIYKINKTIIEYSLDNIFLDLTKISREILEDTRTVLRRYGDFKVLRMINMNLLSEDLGKNRTLFLPFEERYMIALEVENLWDSSRRGLMLLMGHITEAALSVFKSIVTTASNRILISPDIMSEVPSEVIPLFFLSPDFSTLEIQFLWLEDFINFNYQKIFAGVSKDLNQMALSLHFQDPNGNFYENVLNITRDSRFHISGENLRMDVRDQKMNLSFEAYGIVSKYGLFCPTNEKAPESVEASKQDPKGLLTRDRTIYLFCEHPSLNATLVPGVLRESILEINFTDWKEPIDLLQLAEPAEPRFRNYFAVLEKDRLLIFKTETSKMRVFLLMNSEKNNLKLADCIFIKEFKIDHSGVLVVLLCSDKSSFQEYIYNFSLKDLYNFETFGTIVREKTKAALGSSVPERIWRSINKDKSNFKIVDNLAFCKSDINLLSIGSKTTIDVFLHNQNSSYGSEKYVLVNSTMSDKYSEFEIINFKAYRHKTYARRGSEVEYYKYVQVNYNQKTNELQLVHNILRFSPPKDVISEQSIVVSLEDLEIENKLLGVDIISEKDSFVLVDGAELVRFVYRVFIVAENYIYEIKLVEQYSRGDVMFKPFVENFTEALRFRKFSFAGLCDFDSNFKMCRTRELLMVDCIPMSFDSMVHSMIIYKLPPDEESPEVVNPSFSVPQQTGYNEKNSNQILFRGEDNVTRILKTSPRGIVDLYRVNPSLTLHVSVDAQLLTQSSLKLKLANEFEHFVLQVDFYKYSFKYFAILAHRVAEEFAFICICGAFWAMICVLYWMKPILKKCKKLRRDARLCFKKPPQLADPVKSLRESLQKLVPRNQKEAERLRAMLEQAVNAGYIPVEDEDDDDAAREAESQRKALQAISSSFLEQVYG